ncbi:platelet-activating factor acetylhydrolase-like [Dendronephthya gigantea]|uniref:platelet-activating factor acetylhydrolase-like n=1 Tax=Dendronephthya gigantea TaxID=151771 RepID=UPI00106C23C9|nr:platelet-activating factor acetylhydrolase-like [Dendronephthya gigantea]
MLSSLQAGCIRKTNGRFTVGCADYMWGSDVKGGFVRIFYPSDDPEHSSFVHNCDRRKPFWLPHKEYAVGMIKYAKLPSWLLGNVFYWMLGNVQLDCYWNSSLHLAVESNESERPKKEFEKFPCVVFSHGLGGSRCVYSSFCLELASYGYIVAAVEHRDKSASATYYLKESAASLNDPQWVEYHRLKENEDEFQLRNNQVHQRAKECMQTLNFLEQLNEGRPPKNLLGAEFDGPQFKDRLNLDQVSIMGHSFGAATTIAALAKDKRFKCGVAMDAWMFPLGDELYHHTVSQPLLFINTETFHWKKNIKQINELLNHETVERKMVTVRGTSHLTQSDLPSVVPPAAWRFLGVNSQSLDVGDIIDINRKIIATFLSQYFELGKEFSDPEILKQDTDHVLIGTNVVV